MRSRLFLNLAAGFLLNWYVSQDVQLLHLAQTLDLDDPFTPEIRKRELRSGRRIIPDEDVADALEYLQSGRRMSPTASHMAKTLAANFIRAVIALDRLNWAASDVPLTGQTGEPMAQPGQILSFPNNLVTAYHPGSVHIG
jgi:hypothetical protein